MGACLECSAADCCRHRVTTEGGAVLAGLDGEHDLIIGQYSRDGVYTTRKCL